MKSTMVAVNVACALASGAILATASPVRAGQLAELAAEMRKPGAFSPDTGRGDRSYRQARAMLLEQLRADLEGEAALPVLIELVRGIEADKDLPRRIAEALPNEERLIQLLGRLVDERLKGGDADLALADALFRRASGSQNPALLPKLLAYLERRIALRGDPWDRGFDLLVESFGAEPTVIPLLWRWVPPRSAGTRHGSVLAALGRYAGAGWEEQTRQALASERSETRSAAIVLVDRRRDGRLEAELLRSLEEVGVRALSLEAYAEAMPILRRRAVTQPRAFEALLEIFLSRSAHADEAREALLGTVVGRSYAPAPGQLERLVALAKTKPVPRGVFSLLEHFELGAQRATLEGMLDDDERAVPAAYALVARASDEQVGALVASLPKRPPTARVAILSALRERYRSQPWGRELLRWLDDEDAAVASEALTVLFRSQDPQVRQRIDALDEATLLRLASPHTAISVGLDVAWKLPTTTPRLGEPFIAEVTLRNTGRLPLKLPLEVDGHASRWTLAVGDGGVGPLKLYAPGGESVAGQTLAPGASRQVLVNLRDALAALGLGQHRAQLAFVSRARHAPDRGRPDFRRASPPVILKVEPAKNASLFNRSEQAVLADIQSLDPARREAGWERLAASWRPPADADQADEEEDLFAELVGRVIKKGRLGRGGALVVTVENQLLPTSEYLVDARGRFVWSTNVEGAQGQRVLRLKKDEVRELFRLLLQARPFEHEPVQIMGHPYEQQVRIALVLRHRKKELRRITPRLWLWELRHHPALAPLAERLEALRRRAAGDPPPAGRRSR